MGRPSTGALGQYLPEMRQKILEMQKSFSKWDPVTIREKFENDPEYIGKPSPSRSRIPADLHQEDLTRKYERYSELPQPKAVEPERAHAIWEVDAQGVIKIPGLGAGSIINIKDQFSRLHVDSHACMWTATPVCTLPIPIVWIIN
jgi:hypothetical protein